jgi:LacI family transcriptional regulator, galactose operon repressor
MSALNLVTMSMSKVAAAAGVSISTVARVVNGRPGISRKTVASVRNAMKAMGYVAPPPARRRGPKTDAVRGVRTRRVAMLLVGMDPLVTQRLSAPGPVAESLAEGGLQLVYSLMPDPEVLPPDISPKHLDGVILRGLEPTGAAERALRSLPCVWMMTRRSKDFWADYVEPDNRLVSRLAFEYLAQKGVPRMAFLNLQPNYPAFHARGVAFFEACERANMEYKDLSGDALDQSDRLHDVHVAAGVEQQIERLMPMLKKGPVGLFTSGHNYLPSVYRALMSRSVRLGQDVKLVAGDYDPLVRAALIPMPACVDVQIPVISERVVKQLMWRMANREAPGPEGVVVPPRLIPPDLEDVFIGL